MGGWIVSGPLLLRMVWGRRFGEVMIYLKKIRGNEWWSTSSCWTSDEAQAMVFAKVCEAVDCALLLGIKDARVVVASLVNRRSLRDCMGAKAEAAPAPVFTSSLQAWD